MTVEWQLHAEVATVVGIPVLAAEFVAQHSWYYPSQVQITPQDYCQNKEMSWILKGGREKKNIILYEAAKERLPRLLVFMHMYIGR